MRALAGQYLINPNTVARAYLELERGGLIYKKRGTGTYVAERKVTMGRKERLEIARKLLDKDAPGLPGAAGPVRRRERKEER